MEQTKELPVVDLSCLEEYTDGDPESIQELLEAFYETANESLDGLSEHTVDGESDGWQQSAHKLKGAAGYVGAEVMRSLCATAQNMKVATMQERSEILDQIKQQYSAVCDVLEKE